MRSGDIGLGVFADVILYSLLTHIIAKICDLNVGELTVSIGDAHIYLNHIEPSQQVLTRIPYDLPTLKMPENLTHINQLVNGEINWNDFDLINYQYHPQIKLPVAI